MSVWYEPKGDDIDIDVKEKCVNIFVKQDYFGAVYISIPFEEWLNISNQITEQVKDAQN